MKSSRADHRPPVSALPLRSSEQLKASLRKSEQDEEVLDQSEQLAAELLNAAFEAAGLTTKEVAALCGVSNSLVEKWRSREARGCPSFAQLLKLPAEFHFALFKVQSTRLGYGRRLLGDLLETVGALAVLVK